MGTSGLIVAYKAAAAEAIAAADIVERTAVSYTHLDVYKRQGLRGGWDDDTKGAFLVGEPGHEMSIKFGIVGAPKSSPISFIMRLPPTILPR